MSVLKRPVGVGLIALAVGSIFLALRLSTYDWNPTGFVHAGDRFVDPAEAPDGLLVRRNAVGFDGTGFYRLALDPFTDEQDAYGIVLDVPAFRHQRILYPLIVWAVSAFGRASAVGWGLIAVNLAAFGAVGWLGGAIAAQLGRAPPWGLLFPLYPGFAISLGLDTAEIVTAAFALAGILALLRRRFAWASLLFVAAMFSRETSLLVAIGVGLAWLAVRLRRPLDGLRIPPAVFVVPAVAYVGWQVALREVWGQVPVSRGGAMDIAAPFYGLGVAAKGWPQTDGTQAAYHIILVIALFAFIVTAAWAARRTAAPGFAVLGFGAGALLSLFFSEAIWLHHWGFLRAFTEAYLLGGIVVLGARMDPTRLVVGSGALWTSLAVNLVLHP